MAWKWNAQKDLPVRSNEPGDSATGSTVLIDPSEQSLETVGVFLRIMSQFAFDLPEEDAREIAAHFEQWQRHLMLGMARPGSPAATERLPLDQRDWPGVRQYFAQHRRAEHTHVNTSFADMRRIVWALVHGLNRAVEQDDLADTTVYDELERIKFVVQRGSLEEIKRGVLIAVAHIGAVLEERNRARDATIRQLGEQLETLGDQLREARVENALDPLTRVHNRKAFDDYVSQTIDLFRLFGHPACLLLADADRFKQINDRFGHPAGDSVLQALASQLGRTFMMKNDMIARYGGEEFAIVLRHTTEDAGRMLGERLLENIRALEIRHDGSAIPVTVSIGMAPIRPGDTPQTWVECADRALYQAKNAGRDRMVCAA